LNQGVGTERTDDAAARAAGGLLLPCLLALCLVAMGPLAPVGLPAPLGPLARSSAIAAGPFAAAAAEDPPSLYDVEHYDLDVRIRAASASIEGTVAIAFMALDNLSEVVLDQAASLETDSAWTRAGTAGISVLPSDRVAVRLPLPLSPEERDTLFLRYSGVPQSEEEAPFFARHGEAGTLAVRTPAGPCRAHSFWPCKEDPADKASMRVSLTAPPELTPVASGTLESRSLLPDGSVKTVFVSDTPVSPYLLAFALSNFSPFFATYHSGASGRDIPLGFYPFPEDSARAREAWSLLAPGDSRALAVLEALFGPFPFDALDVAEAAGCASAPGQGLILQSRCFLSQGEGARSDLIRRCAQQWFGARVTPAAPQDTWLTEGIASYAEAMFDEAVNGPAAGRTTMESFARPAFAGTIHTSGAATDTAAYATASLKGAWLLRSLRWVLRNQCPLGDATLTAILHSFPGTAPRAAGGTTSEDFVRACEETAGLDLHWFFAPWLYGTGEPILAYDWSGESAAGAASSIHLHLEQLQGDPLYPEGEPYPESPRFFPMLWEVRLYGPEGDSTSLVVHQTSRLQDFLLAAPHPVVRLAIDPDHQVLRDLERLDDGTGLRLLRLEPNPSRGPTRILYRAAAGPLQIRIYDLAGRKVRDLIQGPVMQGVHVLAWDGRSDGGRDAAQGAYFLRLSQGGRVLTRKLIVIR
jgi:aminopeptidase N